jgi:hypothetical protein
VLVSDRRRLQPAVVDRLKLADPAGSTVEKGLDGLFRVVGGGAAQRRQRQAGVGQPRTVQRQPSAVLTQMIQAQRLFDIRTKLIATAKEVDQSAPRCCACLPRNRRFRPLCPYFSDKEPRSCPPPPCKSPAPALKRKTRACA